MTVTSRQRWTIAMLVCIVPVLKAANLTWAGAHDNTWDVNLSTNWTGDAVVFNPGDSVTFSGGANTDPINIVGTVSPSAVNATTVGGPFNFSGGTLRYSFGTGIASIDFGIGTQGLAGATLHLSFDGTSWGHNVNYISALVARSAGGTIDLGPTATGQRRAFYTFTGPVSLEGPLTVTGNSWGNTLMGRARINTILLDGNRQIVNATYNAPAFVELMAISGSAHDLVLSGGGFTIRAANGSGSNLDLRNLVVTGTRLNINDAANANTDDGFATLRANGGSVTLTNGSVLRLNRGVFHLGDLALGGNHVLEVLWTGAQDHRVTLNTVGTSDLWVGTGHPFASLRWNQGQNTYLEVRQSGGGAMAQVMVDDGGLFRNHAQGSNARAVFHLRLLDGARLDFDDDGTTVDRATLYTPLSGAQIRLGDGDVNTPETVRITGLARRYDNKAAAFVINTGAANIIDDGNVVLRYEGNNNGMANHICNLSWNRGAFREGSAGTVFAPDPGNLGFAAVGPPSGPVMSITREATLATAGMLGFYNGIDGNFGHYLRHALGPLTVAGGGSLTFATNGILRAGDLTFASGSRLAVALTGTGSNDCSRLLIDGTLTFDDHVALAVTAVPGLPSGGGPWVVARAATIQGRLPLEVGAFIIETGSDTVMITRRPFGSTLMVR